MLQVLNHMTRGSMQHSGLSPKTLPCLIGGNMQKLMWLFFLLLLIMIIMGCSSKPMHDPTGSKALAYYDDLQHCKFLIKEQTSAWDYGYNESIYVSRCLINRGYSILNGDNK